MPEDDEVKQPEGRKPFAGYENFKQCVDDNQDKDDPQAYCAYLHHQQTGEWPAEARAADNIQHKVIRPNRMDSKGIQIGKEEFGDKEFTTLTMPISSTTVDRDLDNFNTNALKDMKRQLEEGTVGLFLDHGGENNSYPVLDMVGGFYGGEIKEDVLFGKAFVEPENEDAERLVKKLEHNLPIGWSVGFANSSKSENDQGGFEIDKCDLVEVSAVGIPSNPDAIVSFADAVAKRTAVQVKSMLNDIVNHKGGDVNFKTEDDKMEEEENEEDIKQEDEEGGDKSPMEEAVAILAEEYDVSPAVIMDALDEAGITKGDDSEDEDDEEDEEEDEDDGKGITEEDVRSWIRDELDKSKEPEDEDTKGKKSTPKAKEPKGKIVTPPGDGSKSPEDSEQGEDDGLKFNPKIK